MPITIKRENLDTKRLEILQAEARELLTHNDRRFFITPSDELYGTGGNNWGYLWDTAFSVMAIASYDAMRAAELFNNYLPLQHANGRMPHMGMWSSNFPVGALVTNLNWHGRRNQRKDLHGNVIKTSPITQPPLLAVAAKAIADNLPEEARQSFAREASRQIIAYHEWLYKEREINGDGLVITIHPHETGRDDAPSHKDLLQAMPKTFINKMWHSGASKKIFERNRTDKHANADERSDTETVMQAASLALFGLPKLLKNGHVPKNYPYQHFDPGFNAILDRANDELKLLAEMGGVEIPEQLQNAMQRTSGGLQLFWDDSAQAFHGIDARGQVKFVPGQEIGDLLPLYSRHITKRQAQSIADSLCDPFRFGGVNLPSVSRASECYDPGRFWQGADWPPARMLIIEGLLLHGYTALASDFSKAALTQALKDGQFPEYRDADTGAPKGARRFSWTAALLLTALKDDFIPMDSFEEQRAPAMVAGN